MSNFLPVSQLSALDIADWLVLVMLTTGLAVAEIAHVLGTGRSANIARAGTRFTLPLLLIFGVIVLRRLVAL